MNSKLEEKTLWACHNKEIVLPLYVELTVKGESKVAKPIKETPILFGEDARKFEARMKEKRRETPEQNAIRLKRYKAVMNVFKD